VCWSCPEVHTGLSYCYMGSLSPSDCQVFLFLSHFCTMTQQPFYPRNSGWPSSETYRRGPCLHLVGR
jgi:hypothetical protein